MPLCLSPANCWSGLAPRKRDVRPSLSVGPGGPLWLRPAARSIAAAIAGLSPVFGLRDLNPRDSFARDMFGSMCFSGLASQPGSARFPALTRMSSSPGPANATLPQHSRGHVDFERVPTRTTTVFPAIGLGLGLPTCFANRSPVSTPHRPVGPETGLPQQRSASIRSTRGPSGFLR